MQAMREEAETELEAEDELLDQDVGKDSVGAVCVFLCWCVSASASHLLVTNSSATHKALTS
jgi:hypothetical protein